MLDYGYRSKCCLAPIRLGDKTLKKSKLKVKVWVCCTCGTKDIDLISREEALGYVKPKVNWPSIPDLDENIDEAEL